MHPAFGLYMDLEDDLIRAPNFCIRATDGIRCSRENPTRLRIREGAPISITTYFYSIDDPEKSVIELLVNAPYEADLRYRPNVEGRTHHWMHHRRMILRVLRSSHSIIR